MKNDCKYYDQMLGTGNLNELVHASSDCEGENKTIADELIVPVEQYGSEEMAVVPKTDTSKELKVKEAYAITTRSAKEAVGIIKQWAFKWAAYPTLGCTNGQTKKGIEDVVGKEYFDAEKATILNVWSNCVTYPLIAYGVYNSVGPIAEWAGPIADYVVPIVSGIAYNVAELVVKSGDFHSKEKLFKNPTLIGALISTPVKAMTSFASGIKDGYKKLKSPEGGYENEK